MKSSEELFKGTDWRITLDTAPLPDGREKKAEIAHRADSANILAFVRENIVLLLREYRAIHGEYFWMLPGGRINKEIDKTEGARREFREETGYDARDFKYFFTTILSESVDLNSHIFVAQDLFPSSLEKDHDEIIEVHEVELEEALKLVLSQPKIHAPSAIALQRWIMENK